MDSYLASQETVISYEQAFYALDDH